MVGEILNQGERSFFLLISHHFFQKIDEVNTATYPPPASVLYTFRLHKLTTLTYLPPADVIYIHSA